MEMDTEPSCKPYERYWISPRTMAGFCVDKGLRDEWLERLNSLRVLTPKCTCEGHLGADNLVQLDHAVVKVVVQDGLLLKLKAKWQTVKDQFMHALSGIDNATTEAAFGWRIHKPGSLPDLAMDFGADAGIAIGFEIFLDCRQKRQTPEMDPATGNWFEQAVLALERIDHEIWRLLSD